MRDLKPLTNFDIQNTFSNNILFQGVFTIDTLPNKPNISGIINLDTISGIGTHWVCFYNDPKSKFIEYVDSFGAPPPSKIKEFLQKSNKPIQFSDNQVQPKDSIICGHICVMYILDRMNNNSPLDCLFKLKKLLMSGQGIKDNLTRELYSDPLGGFTNINELTRKAKMIDKSITKSKVKNQLEKIETYQLHRPARKNFTRRRVYVHNIDEQWQADLVEMHEFSKQNKDFNYILTVIDCFSKYAWAIPIKNKSSQDIIKAFTKIFKQRKPNKLQTDKGKEFINKQFQSLLKLNNITWFATDSDLKAQICERFNRTLKTKMWKYFAENNTNTWIDILDEIIINYNNSHHRSIKMTPYEASDKSNEHIVHKNLYPTVELSPRPKYDTGDRVRLAKWKSIFEKGYKPNYTSEVFTIHNIFYTNPITYQLIDESGEVLEGKVYEVELSEVK